ncbi:hypothetical protein [Alicyclobacillus mengziensis]|uniref:Copper amine oxidase-like N-terminal domain-containing protein n=1 Tax=Alicyclobacillus mengziensis TaxID=2931921 RepID=A0A9X7VVQ5_9BACL|nr:hypothetical protein [Alicyclobacillus mengziensis]QSO45480.1 hypothetical protein JZ786_12940 [Alicyclobacillus mengziensis]
MKLSKLSATLLALAGATSVIFSSTGPAMANNYYKPYATNIYLNGQEISSPAHIVANDSGQATSWIPIYYLQNALRQVGIQNTWNGNTWNLQVPSGADLSNLPRYQAPSSGSMAIAINGTVVQYAPRIIYKDLSGTEQTTYVPIWYLMQVMTRMNIGHSWDGTNWRTTESQPSNGGGTGSGGTGSTSYESQQNMANAMWNTFNATSFDVNSHPSMSQSGVSLSNPSGAVTASQVATWLADWAQKAKGSNYGGSYHPYSLQYESSSDPYTWASQNGLFQGTGINGSSSPITANEANTIISNLQWWLNGYKVSNGVYTMHVPFVSHYVEWLDFTQPGYGNVTEQNYQSGMAQALGYYNQIKVWGTSTVNVQLPNSSGTNVEFGVSGNNGSYNYGLDIGLDPHSPTHGGVTVSFPNSSSWGTDLTAEVMGLPSTNGNPIGYDIVIRNHNGVPSISTMADATAGQQ